MSLSKHDDEAMGQTGLTIETPNDGPVFGHFGKYRLIALLGEGGMAKAYLALMQGPGGFSKLLVVKAMKEGLVEPEYIEMFMHEARLAAQLSHPNVVQSYEIGEIEGRFFFAMEYLDGQSLRALQRRCAPNRLPLEHQLRILVGVAQGLHHAHTLKHFDGTPLRIVHRDVSPQNVFVTYDGQIKLLDFGIAKAQGSTNFTRAGMIKGKLDYIAPEQLRGDVVDSRADIFPLGVMLWEAVTGKRFSGGAETAEVTKIHNRLLGGEPRLSVAAPNTPMRLVQICDKALSILPEDRHPSAQAFAQELLAYLTENPERPEAQGLADLMGPLFVEDRAVLQAVIEKQIRVANQPGAPFFRSDQELVGLPVIRARTASDGDSDSKPANGELRTGTGTGTTVADVPSRFRPRVLVATAITAACVAAGAYFGSLEPRPVPIVASPERHDVRVRIQASPASVIAQMDGANLSLPFDAQVSKDGSLRKISFQAPGYEPKTRMVSFDRDAIVYVALSPIAGPSHEGSPGAGAPSP